jgi:hypothetical protein
MQRNRPKEKGSSADISESFLEAAGFRKFSEYGTRSINTPPPLTKSRSLTSPIVTIQVGAPEPTAFNLHKSLVCKESLLLSKTFDGAFKEAVEQRCTLSEEDPQLFGYFVEYLYREGWLHEHGTDANLNNKNFNNKNFNNTNFRNTDPLVLVRLYTMGDRLMAKGVQDASLRKLAAILARTEDLPEQDICDLLETTYTELPDSTVGEDPLQAQVLWYAAARMLKLQKLNRFPKLLRDHPQLAVRLCMRAGNAASAQPEIPGFLDDRRFKPESTAY